jgi:hypothetical protein
MHHNSNVDLNQYFRSLNLAKCAQCQHIFCKQGNHVANHKCGITTQDGRSQTFSQSNDQQQDEGNLTPNTNAANQFILAGENANAQFENANTQQRQPVLRPIYSAPIETLSPLREATRLLANWIIDSVEADNSEQYKSAVEAFLALPCLLRNGKGVILGSKSASAAMETCLNKRLDQENMKSHILNHRDRVFQTCIDRPNRPRKPATLQNTVQRAINLIDAKRPADALRAIESYDKIGILTTAETLSEAVLTQIQDLHPLPDGRDALPDLNPYNTFITVTVKEVADVAADLPRMKATALSPWSNELISLVLKDNPALQDTL